MMLINGIFDNLVLSKVCSRRYIYFLNEINVIEGIFDLKRTRLQDSFWLFYHKNNATSVIDEEINHILEISAS